MNEELEDKEHLQKYDGIPNRPNRRGETSRWQRFLEWLIPGLKTKWEQAEYLVQARLRQETGKALQEEGRGRQEMARARLYEEQARRIADKAAHYEEELQETDYEIVSDESELEDEIESLKEELRMLKLKYGARIELSVEPNRTPAEIEYIRNKLQSPLDELDLSVRPHNALTSAQITTIAELAQHQEHELLQLEGVDRMILQELIEVIEENGLSFGMNVRAYL